MDAQGNVGAYTALAIGADGNPVISYSDLTNGDLKVARCTDPACAGKTLSTVVTDGNPGYTSLAIGHDGNPVISYYAGQLWVAKCNDPSCSGGNETLSQVDGVGNAGQYNSIAIGTDGNPVISYYTATAADLRVARCNDPACAGADETITTVDSAADVGQHSSLAIGTDGFPVISYHSWLDGKLRVAHCNDAACSGGDETQTTIPESGTNMGRHTSIAIGIDGKPVISHHDATNGNLRVTLCANLACTASNTHHADGEGWAANDGTSAVIGSNGRAVIAYRESDAGDLKLARCLNGFCQQDSVVDSLENVGFYPSMALGVDGNLVISYWDGTNGDLKVAVVKDPS